MGKKKKYPDGFDYERFYCARDKCLRTQDGEYLDATGNVVKLDFDKNFDIVAFNKAGRKVKFKPAAQSVETMNIRRVTNEEGRNLLEQVCEWDDNKNSIAIRKALSKCNPTVFVKNDGPPYGRNDGSYWKSFPVFAVPYSKMTAEQKAMVKIYAKFYNKGRTIKFNNKIVWLVKMSGDWS